MAEDKKNKARTPKVSKYLTVEQFNESIGKILDLIEKKTETEAEFRATPSTSTAQTELPKLTPKAQAENSTAADAMANGFLPPQYQKVFEKYFDEDDGFTARITFPDVDDKGNETGGITFTIFVPEKFTNTSDAYRKMYKQDLRTRALQPHNIVKGIEEWCKLVARNLRYNKQLKTK